MLRRKSTMRSKRQPPMRHQGLSMGRKYLEALVNPLSLWMLIFMPKYSILNHSFVIFLFAIDHISHQARLIYLLQIQIPMNAEFFRERRPRIDNPTFQSNLIQSTMLFPITKYDIIRSSNYHNANNILYNQSSISNQNDSMIPGAGSNSSRNVYKDFEKFQSQNLIKRNSVILDTAKTDDPFRFKRSKSHLSSYGSSSLSNLPKINDKQVYQNQQKDFNIISLCPKQYKQGIKMFPKFRNQIKADQPNRIRQAFISGKPQFGLAKSRIFNQQMHKKQINQSYKSLRNLNPEKVN